MISAQLHDQHQEFAGTKGLVFFGELDVLSYTRDTNTDSFPQYVDLPGGGREGEETPFETFNRELDEEFSLQIAPTNIVYARAFPSMLDPSVIGYFLVAKLPSTASEHIIFGNEGESYEVAPLPNLLANQRLIPILRGRINYYLDATNEKEHLSQSGALLLKTG